MNLFTPVAVIRSSLYSELNHLLIKKSDSENPTDNALSYNFRRIQIKHFTIHAGQIDYQSDNVYSDSDLPSRICICFIAAKAKLGSYQLNPFNFARHWDVPLTQNFFSTNRSFKSGEFYQKLIDDRFDRLQEMLDKKLTSFFQHENFPSHSRFQKEKSLQSPQLSPERSPSPQFSPESSNGQEQGQGREGIVDNLRNTFREKFYSKKRKSFSKRSKRPRLSSSSSESLKASKSSKSFITYNQKKKVEAYLEHLHNRNRPGSGTIDDFYSFPGVHDDPPDPPPGPAPPGPKPPRPPRIPTKRIYIRKVDCQLNGTPIDQLDAEATEDDDMELFWRMFQYNGNANTMISNSLSYYDFMGGAYIVIFDLTTSGKAGNTFVVPSIRQGHLRLRILFSEAIPHELTMLVYGEFPSTLFVNHRTGKITSSYFAK